MSMFFAVAENESIGRVKFSCLQASTALTRPAAAHAAAAALASAPCSLPEIYVHAS